MKKNNFIGRYTAIFLSFILFGSLVTSCKEKNDDIIKPKTITDIILQNNQFSILREIVLANNLSDELRSENITLFAPNDAAFKIAGISSAMVNSMTGDSARAFVLKHVLKENLTYDLLKAKPGNHATVLNGFDIIVKKANSSDSTLSINNVALIITKDVSAANGKIQIVNNPLVKLR